MEKEKGECCDVCGREGFKLVDAICGSVPVKSCEQCIGYAFKWGVVRELKNDKELS